MTLESNLVREQSQGGQTNRERRTEVIGGVTFATLFGGLGYAVLELVPLATPEGRETFSFYKMAGYSAGTAAVFGGSMYIAFKIQDAYRWFRNRTHST